MCDFDIKNITTEYFEYKIPNSYHAKKKKTTVSSVNILVIKPYCFKLTILSVIVF